MLRSAMVRDYERHNATIQMMITTTMPRYAASVALTQQQALHAAARHAATRRECCACRYTPRGAHAQDGGCRVTMTTLGGDAGALRGSVVSPGKACRARGN